MTSEDRAQFDQWLAESQTRFLAAIASLRSEEWVWKATPETWSIGEIAEHIVVSEALLFGGVRRALQAGPNPDWQEQTREKTERITRVMAPRKGRAVAPEILVPKGDWTVDRVRTEFLAQREQLARFLPALDSSIYECTAQHPFPFFGTLNAWQWLIYIPLHTLRHEKQIAEVKAHPGYPRL